MKLSAETSIFFTIALFLSPAPSQAKQANASKDGEAGFASLFDGKTLEGWRAVPEDSVDEWSVQDGLIVCKGKRARRAYLVWRDEVFNNDKTILIVGGKLFSTEFHWHSS